MTPTADSFADATVLEAPHGPPLDGLVLPALGGEAVPLTHLAAAVRGRAIRAGEPSEAAHRLPMAEAASLLWTRFHKYDAADPRWPDRDRMVFCGDRGALLHATLLELSGHTGIGGDALRRLQQPEAATAQDPAAHPAIDVAPGPTGQGLGHAVGLAMAERLLAARFGRSLVDHRTWVVASSGDLADGLSHEAACLAGQLRLTKLTVLWHDRDDAALRRFAQYGWTVRRADARSPADLTAALAMALRSAKPTLLACHDGGHHDPVTRDGPPERPDIDAAWQAAGARGASARRAWLKRLARHALRPEFERVMAARLPDELHDALAGVRASFAASRPAIATRAASQSVLAAVAPSLPELVGGAAEPLPSAASHGAVHLGRTARAPGAAISPWGGCEHGMAAALNGLALHGGMIPCSGHAVTCGDRVRPALRLAALMRQRVIHVLTRDGGDRPEACDDATHPPLEQLAGLRAMPNLLVFRPADAIETAECWEVALRRADGPSLLALSRQPVPSWRLPGPAGENRAARGGYVLAEAEGSRHATLIATGPEVATAMAARETLRAEGVRVAVVSLPCWELFERLAAAEQDSVLGDAPRIGVEAAAPFGWSRWLGPEGCFVGVGGAGADARSLAWSAPARPNVTDILVAVRTRLRHAT